MAHVATIQTGRLLTRKGMARPTSVQGNEHRPAATGAVAWHPAAMHRVQMDGDCGTTTRAARLASSVARIRVQRIRVSTRLHPSLHGKLKDFGAVTERSQQSIVVQALEEFFARHDDLPEGSGDRRHPVPR